MVTHSSVLAWRIPGTGEPGGLPSLAQSRTRLKRQQQQQTFSFSSSTNICMVVIKTNFTIVTVSDRERGEEDRFGVPGNLYNISEV